MKTAVYDENDIIVDITNTSILLEKGIPENEHVNYKKRILSILEIKKMIPVIEGVYSYVDLSLDSDLSKNERAWRILTYKEYLFCKNIRDGIQKRAEKIYDKQMKSGKVLKFHCDYKKLESVANTYRVSIFEETNLL